MDRSQYIEEQRAQGRRLMGVFPAQYPKEVLWAAGWLPVEIWDPPLPLKAADAHLQPYICPVVKLGLELLLQGKANRLDGFLFPHTCDSIQNLASVVYDYLDLGKPCSFLYHPKAPYTQASRDYYRRQIQDLAQELGGVDEAGLSEMVDLGQEIAARAGELYARRAQGVLDLDDRAFYALLRRGEWLWPSDFLAELKEALARPEREPDQRPAVVISGVLPNPPELLDVLAGAGVRVGHDDFLAMSRRLLAPPVAAGDPWQRLVEGYFGLPPCSSKDSPIAERLAWLEGLVAASGAKGVIFHTVKFCEPELFDVPILVDELKARGIATLTMDTELNQGLTGQISTRIEAFAEML